MSKTRLIPAGIPGQNYGSFAGKTVTLPVVPTAIQLTTELGTLQLETEKGTFQFETKVN